MRRVSIKVCGIVDQGIADTAAEAGADYLGVIFADSPRRLDVDVAARLAARTPASWVGVFVDPDVDAVVSIVERVGLTAVQLHGAETPETCAQIGDATGAAVWKAVRPAHGRAGADAYAGAVDVILLDAGSGGSGRALPWNDIGRTFEPRDYRLFVAGGLDASNVSEAIDRIAPDGVDASSRLETAQGIKDPRRVKAFICAAAGAIPSPTVRG